MVYHHFPHENRNVGWRDPLQKRPETTYGRDSDQLSPTAASIFGSVATAATTFQQWISITKDFLPIAPMDWCTSWSMLVNSTTMWGPRSIAKLVNITPITMVYDTQITIIFMVFINQLTKLGGPHCSISLGIMISGCICHGVQVNPLDHRSTLKLAWTGVFCGAACSFLNMLFYPEHASSKWSTNISTKTRDKLPFDMFHVFCVNDTALQMQHVLWVFQSLLELSRVDISQVKLIIRILRSGLINIIAFWCH